MTDPDRLVREYLDAVRRVGAHLPADQLDELLADLTEHITTARAELQPETEAGVRALLERLGQPESIVAEARLGRPAAPPPTPPVPVRRTSPVTIVLIVVAAVIGIPALLLCAGVLFLLVASPTTTSGRPEPVTSYEPAPVPSGGATAEPSPTGTAGR
jgi:uncharacterized membrane protein